MKQDRQLKQCGKRIYLLYLILCTLWPWSIMIYLFICGQMWPRISKALSRSSLVPLLLPEVRESDFEKTTQSLEGCLSLYTNIHTNIHIHTYIYMHPVPKHQGILSGIQRTLHKILLPSGSSFSWLWRLGPWVEVVTRGKFSFQFLTPENPNWMLTWRKWDCINTASEEKSCPGWHFASLRCCLDHQLRTEKH